MERTFPDPNALVSATASQEAACRTPRYALAFTVVAFERADTLPFARCFGGRAGRGRLAFPYPDSGVEGGGGDILTGGGEGDVAEGAGVACRRQKMNMGK